MSFPTSKRTGLTHNCAKTLDYLRCRKPRVTSFSKKDELFEGQTIFRGDVASSSSLSDVNNTVSQSEDDSSNDDDEDDNPYDDVLSFVRQTSNAAVRFTCRVLAINILCCAFLSSYFDLWYTWNVHVC